MTGLLSAPSASEVHARMQAARWQRPPRSTGLLDRVMPDLDPAHSEQWLRIHLAVWGPRGET